MPYGNTAELPDRVKDDLLKHAQEIYMEAFNSAWDQYADPARRQTAESCEEAAHKVAWAAVKKKYEKGEDGEWRAKRD